MRVFKQHLLILFLVFSFVYVYYELRAVNFFSEPGRSGWLYINDNSKIFVREHPPEINNDTKVLIFNMGASASGVRSKCDDFTVPASIKAMIKLDVKIYIPCSQVTEPFITAVLPWMYKKHSFMRADELESEIDKLLSAGVSKDNIFLSGQSQGGWVSILAAARYPEKFNSIIAFAPGPGLGEMKYSFFSRREMNRQFHYDEVSKAEKIKGLIFYYENDSYGKPEELSFLPEKYGPDLRLITYGCDIPEGHFTAYYDCRLPETIAKIRDVIGV